MLLKKGRAFVLSKRLKPFENVGEMAVFNILLKLGLPSLLFKIFDDCQVRTSHTESIN